MEKGQNQAMTILAMDRESPLDMMVREGCSSSL
jgi:hypothetical protein